MTTKVQMRGALASMTQTLTSRADDAAKDSDVFGQWFGAKLNCNTTIGRATAWSKLPAEHAAFVAPTAALGKATNMLAIITGKANWLAALGAANAAVAQVGALLDTPPA